MAGLLLSIEGCGHQVPAVSRYQSINLCLYQAVAKPNIHMHTHAHTHTHGTTRVSRYQKSKTSLDFTEARDSEWQWHQLGRMQVCTSLQTENHASTPPLSFFTGRMPFLPPNQQCQVERAGAGSQQQMWVASC